MWRNFFFLKEKEEFCFFSIVGERIGRGNFFLLFLGRGIFFARGDLFSDSLGALIFIDHLNILLKKSNKNNEHTFLEYKKQLINPRNLIFLRPIYNLYMLCLQLHVKRKFPNQTSCNIFCCLQAKVHQSAFIYRNIDN